MRTSTDLVPPLLVPRIPWRKHSPCMIPYVAGECGFAKYAMLNDLKTRTHHPLFIDYNGKTCGVST